jgi:hypothetical protein
LLYHANEFIFDLPMMLKDKTINVFSLHDTEPGDFSLVVSRGPILEGENISSFTARQIKHFSKSLSGFELLRHIDTVVNQNVPATFLDFKWNSQASTVNQWQLAFLAPERSQLRELAVLVTATCKDNFTPEWSRVFDSVMQSIQLRH